MSFGQSQLPSQGSFHSSQTLKTFKLLKYSSAVSNEGAKSHRWKHDTRSDLLQLSFTYIEVPLVGSQYERHLEMVVSAGNEILERADVHQIAQCSHEFDERRRYNLIPAQVEAPVQLVVKFPCIALRFPGSPLMVRRFQLKFNDETDYFLVRDTLRDVGLPLKESGPGSRPESRMATPSSQTGPMSFASPSSQPQWPPVTTQSQFFQQSYSNSTPTLLRSIAPATRPETSFSMRTPRIISPDLERVRSSSVLETSLERPRSIDSLSRNPAPRPSQMSTPTSSFSFTSGSRLLAERATGAHLLVYPTLPSPGNTASSSTAISGSLGPSSSPHFRSETVNHRSDPPSSPLPNGHIQSQYYFDGKALRRSTTSQAVYETSSRLESQSQPRHLSTVHDLARPVSAPIGIDSYDARIDDISSWVPPRRELPFPKAKPKETKKKAEPSKLSHVEASTPSGSRTLPKAPPINKAVVIKTPPPATAKPKAKATKKGAAQRKKAPAVTEPLLEVPDSQERPKSRPSPTLSPVAAAPDSPLASKSATVTCSPEPTAQKEATAASRKRRAATELKPTAAKIPKMVSSSTQTQTGSGRDHTALARVATPIPAAAMVEPAIQVPSSAPAPTPQPMMGPPRAAVENPEVAAADLENTASVMQNWVEKHTKPGKQAEAWEHPKWDTATEEERHDILEDWMCRQLEDPKFMELCKTMETVWQRSGMDMGR